MLCPIIYIPYYYFADLEGNRDKDGDGYFGEFIVDDVDFIDPEFLVGRLPGTAPQEIDEILKRTEKYDKDNGLWKRNVLLAGGTIFYPRDSNIDTTLIDRYFTLPRFNNTIIEDKWILSMKPDIILNDLFWRDMEKWSIWTCLYCFIWFRNSLILLFSSFYGRIF